MKELFQKYVCDDLTDFSECQVTSIFQDKRNDMAKYIHEQHPRPMRTGSQTGPLNKYP